MNGSVRKSDRDRSPVSWSKVPREPWPQKIYPGHVYRRLQDLGILGERRRFLKESIGRLGRQAGHALRLAVDGLRPDVPFVPLLVLTSPRSGSTWLCSLLQCHPEIAWGGELWNPVLPRSLPVTLVPDWLNVWHLRQNLQWQARRAPCRYSGAKLMGAHIAIRHLDLNDVERSWPDARSIVIVRRNIGMQIVSLCEALMTLRFAQRSDEPRHERRPIRIDPRTLRQWRQGIENRIRAIASHRIGQRALWLLYEELDGNPEPAFREAVWPHLSLADVPVCSPLRKQRRGTLADRVVNYSEVKRELEAAVLPIETPSGRGYCFGPPKALIQQA